LYRKLLVEVVLLLLFFPETDVVVLMTGEEKKNRCYLVVMRLSMWISQDYNCGDSRGKEVSKGWKGGRRLKIEMMDNLVRMKETG